MARGGNVLNEPLSTENLLSRTLAELPTQGVRNGAVAWAEDGRKAGEGSGAGTGAPVYFDKSAGTWMSYRTDTEVTT